MVPSGCGLGPCALVRVRGVWWFVVRGVLVMLTSGAVLAGASGPSVRLACVAALGVDGGRVPALCRAVAAGMAEVLGREVAVVAGAADVALVVSRLGETQVRARLDWSGEKPGAEVDLGSMDAPLSERAYRGMAKGLLAVSPPP